MISRGDRDVGRPKPAVDRDGDTKRVRSSHVTVEGDGQIGLALHVAGGDVVFVVMPEWGAAIIADQIHNALSAMYPLDPGQASP